ncbi:MAG TPA: helix-turn-helix transcriptional regulator [Candidatus Binataceae bacterium]|jgi:cytoskeleton protein RodZ
MSAARETEETVSSGSETKPVGKLESGVNPRDGAEAAENQASKPGGENPPAEAAKAEDAGTAAQATPAEPPKPGADKTGAEGEPSLGKILTAARERRGASRADVVAEARIPAHYIDMIERSDYGLISDQLYLMPFVRRYAAFLGLDGEEVAMRFVREVQRAEGAAAAPRMSEPLTLHDRKRAPWGRMAVVIIVLSAIVVLYVIVSDRHRGEFGSHHAAAVSEPAAPVGAMPPAAEAPAPPAAEPPAIAPAPMAAPAPQSVSPPQAAAPVQIPQTSVGGDPAAPGASRPASKTPPPKRTTAPSDSTEE